MFVDDASYYMRIHSPFRFDAQFDPSLLDRNFLYADGYLSRPSLYEIFMHRTTISMESAEFYVTTRGRVGFRDLSDNSTELIGSRQAGLRENYLLVQLMMRRGHSLTHADRSKDLRSRSRVRRSEIGGGRVLKVVFSPKGFIELDE